MFSNAKPSISFSPSHGHFVIFLLIVTSNVCNPLHTLEQPVRESLLRPRNYNPHPYQPTYHLHTQGDRLIDGLNTIDSGTDTYVDTNLFNFNGLSQASDNPLPARHPSNGLYRCLSFSKL